MSSEEIPCSLNSRRRYFRIYIDFADSPADSFLQQRYRNSRTAMEDQWDRDSLPDIIEAVQIQTGRTLINTVGISDGYGQGIDTAFLSILAVVYPVPG